MSNPSPVLTRRQSIKVAAAALALARSLGIPPALLASQSATSLEDRPGRQLIRRITMKWYLSAEGKESRLLYSELLPEVVQNALVGGASQIEAKFFDVKHGMLGGVRLPQELQGKLYELKPSLNR